MIKKIKILCMTFCFLTFLTVPAIAQDSNVPIQASDSQIQNVTEEAEQAELDHIEARPESVSVTYGKTQAVKIFAVYLDESERDVTKSVTTATADDSVATMASGKVKGISVGETTITVSYMGQDTEIQVTVTAPVKKLTAEFPVYNVYADENATISLSATYANGDVNELDGPEAIWKSSKPMIATVEDGEVTGLAVGSTKITATYGGKTATTTVNVIAAVDHLLVKPGMVAIAKGKTQTVTVYAVSEDGDLTDITKNIRLYSDDEDVATVTGAVIKGIMEGEETVVTGEYMGASIEIPVKVTPVLKTLKAVDIDSAGLTVNVDETETISLKATYADGSSETLGSDYVTCTSGKTSIATVDGAEGEITVTGVAKGSTTITLSFEGKKVTVKVKVIE